MPQLRLVTYNVHRCLGRDGMCSPARIAEVIASCQPDVVALQELDVRRARSGGIDQAHEIGRALGMSRVFFHPAVKVLEEEFGDAIITDLPSRQVKAGALPDPGFVRRPYPRERRGALWIEIESEGHRLQIINTHFGLGRLERRMQSRAILGPDWLGHPDCRPPVVVLGDFNSLPGGRVYGAFCSRLQDAHRKATKKGRPRATFPSGRPFFRIDHTFVSSDIRVSEARTLRTGLSSVASDHLPLVVDLELRSAAASVQSAERRDEMAAGTAADGHPPAAGA